MVPLAKGDLCLSTHKHNDKSGTRCCWKEFGTLYIRSSWHTYVVICKMLFLSVIITGSLKTEIRKQIDKLYKYLYVIIGCSTSSTYLVDIQDENPISLLVFLLWSVLLIFFRFQCCVFCLVCLFSMSCIHWFLFFKIIHAWLSLWCYLTYIQQYMIIQHRGVIGHSGLTVTGSLETCGEMGTEDNISLLYRLQWCTRSKVYNRGLQLARSVVLSTHCLHYSPHVCFPYFNLRS